MSDLARTSDSDEHKMEAHMKTIDSVEAAKAFMASAIDWSILHWLAEKRKVRQIADRGTAALDEEERRIKSTWPEDLTNAYAALCPPSDDDPYAAAEYEFAKQQADSLPDAIRERARRVREADDEATRARLAAEQAFDDAERRMSTALARRGAELAIEAYDIRYKALAEAEAARDA
jgi:hypothetical protein